MIPQDIIDKVLDRADIVDVVNAIIIMNMPTVIM